MGAAYLPTVDGSGLATMISSVTTTGVQKDGSTTASMLVAWSALYTDITLAKTP